MAWTCVRCQKRIFVPRKEAFRYAMTWKFIKSKSDLVVEMKNLKDISPDTVITHLSCDIEKDGFEDRMKSALKMPESSSHPML